MSRMRMTIPPPTSAPSTKMGCVTWWPPCRLGVIIGPQQLGAVLAMMVPPVSTGPSIGAFGSCRLLVNVSMATLRRCIGIGSVRRCQLPCILNLKT